MYIVSARGLAAIAVASFLITIDASAAFDDPAISGWGGWARNTPGTVYHQWDVFTDDNPGQPSIQDFTPDVGSFGPGSAQLSEFTDTGFITGGGNIYGPAIGTVFQLEVAGTADPGQQTRVALQIRTQGTELDYGSVTLGGVSPDVQTELDRQVLGGFGGDLVDTLFLWTLADGATSYQFAFNGSGAHMSLDQVAVDVAPVPVPIPVILFASAALPLLRRSRKF